MRCVGVQYVQRRFVHRSHQRVRRQGVTCVQGPSTTQACLRRSKSVTPIVVTTVNQLDQCQSVFGFDAPSVTLANKFDKFIRKYASGQRCV